MAGRWDHFALQGQGCSAYALRHISAVRLTP
jgi:hypothetical protein